MCDRASIYRSSGSIFFVKVALRCARLLSGQAFLMNDLTIPNENGEIHLQSTKRTGWVRRGIHDPESVADHMYRMGAMAFLAGDGLNKDRCIKIALVHDMAECIVGDIAPSDNVSKQEKHAKEKAAMEHIKTLVPEETGKELYDLWMEYETQSSSEACFVKDLDKFDMILQAYEYEQSDKRPGELQDFFESTKGRFTHPMVKEWVQDLYKMRQDSSGINVETDGAQSKGTVPSSGDMTT